MFGSTWIFPSLAMSRISVRLVLFMSGITRNLDSSPHVMLLFRAANALVGSCFDYCNSLFIGLSALDLC